MRLTDADIAQMWKARAEAAEARIAAVADALVDFRLQMTPAAAYGFEAALAEPVEPQPSACATKGCRAGAGHEVDCNPEPCSECADSRFVCDTHPAAAFHGCNNENHRTRRPCPSCTPPDPKETQ